MILTNKSRYLVVAVFSLTLVGCSARVADLTFVSTRNIDLSNATIDVRNGTRATGKDCAYALLGIIPTGLPNLETAIDRALDAGHGNVMVDQVTRYRFYYAILFSASCIDVEGTVLQTSTSDAASPS